MSMARRAVAEYARVTWLGSSRGSCVQVRGALMGAEADPLLVRVLGDAGHLVVVTLRGRHDIVLPAPTAAGQVDQAQS